MPAQASRRLNARRIALAGLAASVAALAWWAIAAIRPDPARISRATILQGQALYAANCASCHGADLAGQPDWRRPLASGRLPAPPHDASGHTWHHGDALLVRLVKEGSAAVVSHGYQSDMPGFGDRLSDDEVRAVLAFIKSTWPERERQYQAEMSRREREEGAR